MIKGCGIDIVRIERIEKIIKKWGESFTNRVFTHSERQYCEKKKSGYQSYAGRFAAKEAFLKALGLGLNVVSWKDVEVNNNHFQQDLSHATPFHIPNQGNDLHSEQID